MALQVAKLTREFTFKKDGKDVTLNDPNPEFSAEEVMKFYASQYPELTTSSSEGPKIDKDKAVYTFKTTVGTKG